MSLVSSDSEGEQNEIRNLQEKLESTMRLVIYLSSQLSELKDQVRKSLGRYPGLPVERGVNVGTSMAALWMKAIAFEDLK